MSARTPIGFETALMLVNADPSWGKEAAADKKQQKQQQQHGKFTKCLSYVHLLIEYNTVTLLHGMNVTLFN